MFKRKNYVIISGILAIIFGYGLYKENNVHGAIRSLELHKIEFFKEINKANSAPKKSKEATIKDWHHLFDKIDFDMG